MSDFLPPVVAVLVAETKEFTAKMAGARHEMAKFEAEGNQHMQRFAAVGKAALLGFAGAAVALGGVAAHAAIDAQQAHERMAVAIRNAGEDVRGTLPLVAQMAEQYNKLGFSTRDVEQAFGTMVTATHSSAKAFALMGDAADLARYKHIGLAEAGLLLARAQGGSVRALKELGITLEKGVPHAQALADAMAELHRRIGGQAAAAANTYAGKIQAMRVQAEELAVKVGTALIPVIEKLVRWVSDATKWFEHHRTTAKALAVTVGTVLAGAIAAYIAKLTIAIAETTALVVKTVLWNAAALVMIVRNYAAARAAGAAAAAIGGEAAAMDGMAVSATAALGPLGLLAGAVVAVNLAAGRPNTSLTEWGKGVRDAPGEAIRRTLEFINRKPLRDGPNDAIKKMVVDGTVTKSHSVTKSSLASGWVDGHPNYAGLNYGGASGGGGGGSVGGGGHHAATHHHKAMTAAAAAAHNKHLADIRRHHAEVLAEHKRAHEATLRMRAAHLQALKEHHEAVRKAVEAFHTQATAIKDQRKALDAEVAARTADLQAMTQAAKSFHDAIYAGLGGNADIGAIFAKNLSDPAKAATAFASSLDDLKKHLADTLAFSKDLQSLAKAGLSQDIIGQIAGQGPTVGDQLAKGILSDPSSVASLNDTMKQIGAAATAGADALTQQFYQPGIDSMTALIAGLKSQYPALDTALADIAARVKAVLGGGPLLPVPAVADPSNVRGALGVSRDTVVHVHTHIDGRKVAEATAVHNRRETTRVGRRVGAGNLFS